jgi:group I intron endonuclease
MLIYLITNEINKKKYVGQTIQPLSKRWQHHCWFSTTKTKMPIALAIHKYGEENFTIRVIRKCSSQEELDRMEKYYAKRYATFSPSGYNLKAGNGRGALSDETKLKISLSNTGKTCSEETRRRLSISHIGIKMSLKTRRKLSRTNKGKAASPQCYERAREVNSKTYYLLDPDGCPMTIINMKRFCTEHDLSPPNMCWMYKGAKNHHHGWKRDLIKAPLLVRKKIRNSFFWTPRMDALLGTKPDTEAAVDLGVTKGSVWCRRIKLGISAARGVAKTGLARS